MIVITILYLFIYLLIIYIDHTHNGTKYIHIENIENIEKEERTITETNKHNIQFIQSQLT